jgi:hypothetical protein
MQIPDEVLAWAIDQTRAWIQEQRALHRPSGLILPHATRLQLRPFFAENTLSSARVRTIATIPNPPFLEKARALGLPVEIDFSQMAGLTLVDTILISGTDQATDPTGLMFHELVHVVQYQILGLDEFARRYVQGIVESGFDYYRIPLEIQAFNLAARFTANPAAAFSVAQEVDDPTGRKPMITAIYARTSEE